MRIWHSNSRPFQASDGLVFRNVRFFRPIFGTSVSSIHVAFTATAQFPYFSLPADDFLLAILCPQGRFLPLDALRRVRKCSRRDSLTCGAAMTNRIMA